MRDVSCRYLKTGCMYDAALAGAAEDLQEDSLRGRPIMVGVGEFSVLLVAMTKPIPDG
jgi:hypothetical protein